MWWGQGRVYRPRGFCLRLGLRQEQGRVFHCDRSERQVGSGDWGEVSEGVPFKGLFSPGRMRWRKNTARVQARQGSPRKPSDEGLLVSDVV